MPCHSKKMRQIFAAAFERYGTASALLAAGIAHAATAPDTASGQANAAAVSPGVATVGAAAIAAIASICGAILTFIGVIFNEARRRANDRKIARLNAELQERLLGLKGDNDTELARISAQLKVQSDLTLAEFNKAADSRMSAEAARRSYEYEARKRLYADCEPLLFQLSQQSRVAIGRIINIARAAREGQLDGKSSLLGGDVTEESGRGYYFRSTLYQLLAPLAVAYLLEAKLTLLDISLDPWIKRQFTLSEAALRAPTRDFRFAAMPPVVVGYRETADVDAANVPLPRHLKQGIFLGRLDNLLETFVDRANDSARLVTFGRFEDLIADRDARLCRTLMPFIAILTDFHPKSRPVFWRILTSQYFLFRAIRRDVRARLERGESDDTLKIICLELAKDGDLCWRDEPDEEVFSAIRIGHQMLRETLPTPTETAPQTT